MLLPTYEEHLHSKFQVDISKTVTCRSWTEHTQTHKLNDMPRVTDYKRTIKVVVGVKFASKIALRFGKNIVVIGHLNYLVNFPCDCYLCSQIF